MDEKQSVTIIGSDHFNTLAVIRCIGRSYKNYKIVIHKSSFECSDSIICFSKYSRNHVFYSLNTPESIFNCLCSIADKEKSVIITCSDLSAYAVDYYFKELSSSYILPGFVNTPGRVIFLMNKYNQYLFSQENAIPIANSQVIKKTDNGFFLPDDIPFPCVIKPLVSAFGQKTDISVANSIEDLERILKTLKGYDELLLQQYIKKDYEVTVYGGVFNHNNPIFIIAKKIRETPPPGEGSTCFAQIVADEGINSLSCQIIRILRSEGYRGMIDFELLIQGDTIYLNEINFRHSGCGYGLIDFGCPAPSLYVEDIVGKEFHFDTSCYSGFFQMTEPNDLHNVRIHKLTLFRWLKDVFKAKAFAIINRHDCFCSIKYFWNTIISFLFRKRKNEEEK